MADLRMSEEKLDKLIETYNKVRHATIASRDGGGQQSPSFNHSLPEVSSREASDTDNNMLLTTSSLSSSPQLSSMPEPEAVSMSLSEVVSHLDEVKSEIEKLQPKMTRFRERLDEKDPVSQKSRYGIKTQIRVQNLLKAYEAIATLFSDDDDNENNKSATSIISQLQTQLQQQQAQQAAELLAVERKQQQEKEEQERIENEARILEEQRREEERKRLEEQEAAELAELARQADQIRQQRQTEKEAEQKWIESIKVSADGVKEQIQVLKESTANDIDAQKVALKSLYTLYQQINAHPEETKFRRIRRDHEQFNKDIGRHKGGKEILIASGFELGAIDDVPCFLSKEPDIENDMDGWSKWFDLLKATLQILEQEQ